LADQMKRGWPICSIDVGDVSDKSLSPGVLDLGVIAAMLIPRKRRYDFARADDPVFADFSRPLAAMSAVSGRSTSHLAAHCRASRLLGLDAAPRIVSKNFRATAAASAATFTVVCKSTTVMIACSWRSLGFGTAGRQSERYSLEPGDWSYTRPVKARPPDRRIAP